MTNLTLAQINTAIKTTLTFPNVVSQDVDQLTEAIAEPPTLQVYFDHIEDHTEGVNRGSFGPLPMRKRLIVFNVDCLATVRRDIGDDMAQVYILADLVQDKLDQQNAKPLFGLAGIKDFQWKADRVTFVYAEQTLTGIRFTLGIWVY